MISKSSLRHVALLALASGAAPLFALNWEDGEPLNRVYIHGVKPWTIEITYDSNIAYPPGSYANGFNPYRRYMATEEYQEYRQELAASLVNIARTSDVRCNALATPDTKATTSQSDAYTRYAAALQLFKAIIGAQGILGIRASIAQTAPVPYNGTMHAAWTITYADGGSEKWVVHPGINPALIVDANYPPPPSGDGIPKPCPFIGKG